jgi:peptide/nickel transport system permease protein
VKSELFRFLLFIIVLSLFASLLSSFRSQDKAFAFADGGLTPAINPSEQSFFQKSIHDYFTFCKSLLVGGGVTATGESIYSHIGARMLPTFHLALFAILFGSFFGIFLSLFPLYHRSLLLHQSFVRLSEIILSTPVFVFAILLLIIFFYQLDLFPPGGYESFQTYYVVLPGIALGIRVFARVYLFQAKEVWIESNSSYILLLQTRGYPWKHIVFTEIFRKVFPLTIIVIILDFSSLISGAMIVEEIFFFPGIGKSLFYSIKSMDTQLLATLLLYVGVVFYIMNRIAFYWQKLLLGEGHESNV